MNVPNALAGLIGNYEDSDEENGDVTSVAPPVVVPGAYHHVPQPVGVPPQPLVAVQPMFAPPLVATPPPPLPAPLPLVSAPPPLLSTPPPLSAPPPLVAVPPPMVTAPPPMPAAPPLFPAQSAGAVHPAPIPHCPWSACYDEGSGFTYYWNQHTNAVTWEAPPEYLLALKVAQQHLQTAGSAEVTAEEWQLYQKALVEKQNSHLKPKPVIVPRVEPKKPTVPSKVKTAKYATTNRKRLSCVSDDEDEKIELITSYHNSDSESNDEAEPAKPPPKPQPPPIPPSTKGAKNPHKKQKTKHPLMEYGPALPPNQVYTEPIGPQLPPETATEVTDGVKTPEIQTDSVKDEVNSSPMTPKPPENIDKEDEETLLKKLKDKAQILENLGGDIPTDLQELIKRESNSRTASPDVSDKPKSKPMDTNIDDLLAEIEKKELPMAKKGKIDIFSDENNESNKNSAKSSPTNSRNTSPKPEIKPLFPSSLATEDKPISLFPSAVNITNGVDKPIEKSTTPPLPTEKKPNVYLIDSNETVSTGRKKLRISNSVLPAKKSEPVAYTTKYSSHIEGFSSERVGLGFSKDEEVVKSPKNAINYGNGLMFTKGETLNEDKKDEALDDLTELLEAKLNYLNQVQPCVVTPVQEMLIQMQTLVGAFRFGALSAAYWRRWAAAAAAALANHEATAAPPGWTVLFQRSEGRYQYIRADGLAQWEYPAAAHTEMDMDICTTPPPPPHEEKESPPVQPPLPPTPPPPLAPPPPPPPPRMATPPPPVWSDPPPPGTDDLPPLPEAKPPKQPKPPKAPKPPKKPAPITDELLSFYNDIAAIESQSQPSPPPPPPPVITATPAPAPPAPPPPPSIGPTSSSTSSHASEKHEKDKEKEGKKKKSKVKISSSMGMKHKSVSSLVAKWQQVAEEIHSD